MGSAEDDHGEILVHRYFNVKSGAVGASGTGGAEGGARREEVTVAILMGDG